MFQEEEPKKKKNWQKSEISRRGGQTVDQHEALGGMGGLEMQTAALLMYLSPI